MVSTSGNFQLCVDGSGQIFHKLTARLKGNCHAQRTDVQADAVATSIAGEYVGLVSIQCSSGSVISMTAGGQGFESVHAAPPYPVACNGLQRTRLLDVMVVPVNPGGQAGIGRQGRSGHGSVGSCSAAGDDAFMVMLLLLWNCHGLPSNNQGVAAVRGLTGRGKRVPADFAISHAQPP